MEMPSLGTHELALWVPAAGCWAHIAPHSAIVGRPTAEGAIEIYYEGNIYGWDSMKTYADLLWRAVYRCLDRYPTVAFAVLPPEQLQYVGRIEAHTITLEDEAALAAWLERPVTPEELTLSQGDPVKGWDWWYHARYWRRPDA